MAYARRIQLAITVDRQGLSLAVIAGNHANPKIDRVLRFDLPADTEWASPETAPALTSFLREHRVHPGRAILGLSSDFCLYRWLDLPTMEPGLLPAAVSIQAEQQFPGNGNSQWQADYMATMDDKQSADVLLLAARKTTLQAITGHLQSAGIKTVIALPVSVALITPRLQTGSRWIGLHVTDASAELVVCHDQRIQSIITVTINSADSLNDLTHELRMASMMIAAESNQSQLQVKLFNDSRHDDSLLKNAIHQTDLACEIIPPPAGQSAVNVHSLLALIRYTDSTGKPPVDFLHSNLSIKTSTPMNRRSKLALLAAVAIVAAVLSFVWDITSTYNEIDVLNEQIKSMQPDLDQAQAIIDRTNYAGKWFDRQPRLLECQLALANAFGYEGNSWATSIAIRDDLTGLVTGNATSEQEVLEFLDRLKETGSMQSVKLVFVRQSSGRSGNVSFAIRFQYQQNSSES